MVEEKDNLFHIMLHSDLQYANVSISLLCEKLFALYLTCTGTLQIPIRNDLISRVYWVGWNLIILGLSE